MEVGIVLQEGNSGDWRLKLLRQKQEELPWFNKQTNEDWLDLLVLRVKSPRDLCVMPRSMREEVGRNTRGDLKRGGSSLGQTLTRAEGGCSWERGQLGKS